MSLSGNEFSTTSDKERTLAQCVGDPPASMAVSLMAFPVTRSPRTPRFTYPLVPSSVAAKRSGIIARSEERMSLERSSL
jgi:hypothetical protein